MPEERMERRLAAILAADIAGYSALMGADEARTVRDLKGHQAVVLPMVAEFSGRIIDIAGDGILAEFASVVNAVKCALAIQERMAERNAAIEPARRMQFRVGINIGDVVYDDVRIYGDGINVAARLENIAEPGGICISGKVFEEINGRIELACEDIGEQQLKNIARPVRVYNVRVNGSSLSAAPVLPDKPSIAVLPFQNMSGDAEQEFFADGITEDLITDLSKVSGLFVIARNSSFVYKGRPAKVQEIGRDLGVRFVLEGSVRKAANRVRITAQLIDGRTGGHLWAERFDRDLTDIFATQDEVVQKIVGALAITLTPGEERRLRGRGTINVEAYETWLRARELLTQGTREAVAQARALYRRAIELDPSFAMPHAGLALASVTDYVSGWAPDAAQALNDAERWARRALELSDQEPVSHMALGGCCCGGAITRGRLRNAAA
jgi:adenylate cyclase